MLYIYFNLKCQNMAKSIKKQTERRRRISKREYPKRICLQSGIEFIPTDARQKFLNPQMRIDYNNDRAKAKLKSDKQLLTGVKKNYQIMIKIRESSLYKRYGKVPKTLLDYEGFDLSQYHKKVINSSSKREVLVCYDLGIECIDIENGEFVIHNLTPKK